MENEQIHVRLRDLLNYGTKLPSFDEYLETLRWEICNKFGNRCITELEYLIMDGLYYEEYTHFKNIINTIKQTNDPNELDKKLNKIGILLYQCRQRKSLSIAHYSFHGYVNLLLHKHNDKFTQKERTELYGLSLMLEHVFNCICKEWQS